MPGTLREDSGWRCRKAATCGSDESGSPGGLGARLAPATRVTFRLSPVRGVPRDRLPEAVKSAIRFVRPAELQQCAAGANFGR